MTAPTQLVLPAPGKLNLFLHVTGRRADGYHELESVFVPITLADTVTLTLREDGQIRLIDAPPGLNEENDLACRAARALQLATATQLGVDIHLHKVIPQSGGLGGGSSDAATTLLGLNRLWALGQTRDQLRAVGAKLGADVPFFIFGQPAFASGVGERLLAVSKPPSNYVVAFPGVGVATASVFADANLTRNTQSAEKNVFPEDCGHNDLQPVAERLQPRISALCDAFTHTDAKPRMTGSGSCVFAPTVSASSAQNLAAALGRANWQCWAVKSIDHHPLISFAPG